MPPCQFFDCCQDSTVTVKSLYMITYVCQNFGKYRKANIRHHTFYLVISLTICPKLVLILIEWKINNPAKTNSEVSLKKIHTLTLKTEVVAQTCSIKKVSLEILQNSQENPCVGVSFLIKLQAWGTFNIMRYIFSQKTWVFTTSILTIFVNLWDVFTFTYCKKTNDVSILSAVFFDLELI